MIGACIEMHRALGPGLLESVYEECVAHELALRGLAFERQKVFALAYKGIEIPRAYRIDLLVEDRLVVELKAVERLLPLHEAQLITYLRVAQRSAGLLVNFNVPALREGLRRMTIRDAPRR